MKRNAFGIGALLAAAVLLVSTPIYAQTPTPTPPKIGVTGTMDIMFNTRTTLDNTGDLKAGSPALGIKDVYKLNLSVNERVNFTGEITRRPNLYSRMIARKKQTAELYYNVVLNAVNPKNPSQTKGVGKWVGIVPIDVNSGAYQLADGPDSKLRFAVDQVGQQSAFQDLFGGYLIGKAEKKEGLAAYTYKRVVGNKEVSVTVQAADPMTFSNIRLARGPSDNYLATTVNGRLDYDYETGNYYTDGIRFTNSDGVEDIVTGSIKWVEDPNRDSNGKGRYEFNLRWNEAKNKPKAGDGAAFQEANDEDAFFTIDSSIPSLTGTIDYVDVLTGSQVKTKEGDDLPSSSKVTYNLVGSGLTKEQVMAFTKLWLIGIGPINDE